MRPSTAPAAKPRILIKAHKTHLASDRTSCRRAVANQVRLVLHTAAYWLLLAVRDAIPMVRDLAKAEFSTLRLRLVKIAVRVQESMSRIRLSYAACHPEAKLFQGLATALSRHGRAVRHPDQRGKRAPTNSVPTLQRVLQVPCPDAVKNTPRHPASSPQMVHAAKPS